MLRFLAIRASVFIGTHASVGSLTGVVTCAAVATWPMVRAVVEVLIAEQAAPAFFADAVPGSAAGAVNAARVPLALVTKLAHPPRVAAEMNKNGRQ